MTSSPPVYESNMLVEEEEETSAPWQQHGNQGRCSRAPSREQMWCPRSPLGQGEVALRGDFPPAGPGIPHGADQRPPDEDAGYAANCLPFWDTQWYAELQPGNFLQRLVRTCGLIRALPWAYNAVEYKFWMVSCSYASSVKGTHWE